MTKNRESVTDNDRVDKREEQKSEMEECIIYKERLSMLLGVRIASQRQTEKERGKQRQEVEIFCCSSSGVRVQPTSFGCGLSFNANRVFTVLSVTVPLHYLC